MTFDEAEALREHAKQLSELLEVPISVFSELIKWTENNQFKKKLVKVENLSSINDKSLWAVSPIWTGNSIDKSTLRELRWALEGKLINGAIIHADLILSERELTYKQHSGGFDWINDLKNAAKNNVYNKIIEEYLTFNF